ncbi:MAG: indolepyruvate oxidoreductase subunit beta [Synergistes sp.]|nr:indolepyruvate oxidoreductase subunit beta [Synergistes sp.]
MASSIIIAGVGGQGTLLASRILAACARTKGLFVRTSETIGMAQRGGSVSSHLLIDAKNLSPIIPQHHADILLGFELAECVRMIPKMRADAKCVINVDEVIPTNVALGKGVYLAPEYRKTLKERFPGALFVSAGEAALKAGDIRTLNIVLLGAAAGRNILPFTAEEVRTALVKCVRPKLVAMNEKAFELGLASCEFRW